MPIGVIERLARGTHRKDDEIVDLALILRLHPLIRIECAVAAVAPRHHAGDPAGQIGDVKRVDLFGAALAVENPLPGRLYATAEWRHHAEARDDNPPHIHHSSPRIAAHKKKPVDRSNTARPVSSAPRGGSAFSVLFKKFCGVADGQNRFRGIVGDFTTEFFFKCHHKLDGVEAVGAEVVNEARVVDHFFGFNTKVFDHDLLNSLANLTHRSTSCLFPLDPSPRRYEPSWSLNFPSQSRIVLIWPRHSRQRPGERRQAPHRQYTGFQNSATAFFAHPLMVRLSYFPSLDYKPRSAIGNRLPPR